MDVWQLNIIDHYPDDASDDIYRLFTTRAKAAEFAAKMVRQSMNNVMYYFDCDEDDTIAVAAEITAGAVDALDAAYWQIEGTERQSADISYDERSTYIHLCVAYVDPVFVEPAPDQPV